MLETVTTFLTRLYYVFTNIFFYRKIKPADPNFNVLIIGAGFSGIGAGANFLLRGFKNFTILEKYEEIGGTWHEATYPGAACDVASHLYCFSFFPNPNWSKKWSEAAEIKEYLIRCCKKFGLYEHIKFKTYVDEARWDNDTKKWTVTTKDGKKYTANVLISASGALNVPITPEFKDAEKFQGQSCHTYYWPKKGSENEIDYAGKKVSLIGTGASAVQVLPRVAETCQSVTVFQRTAAWAPPKIGAGKYDSEWQRKFQNWPCYMLFYRWFLYWTNEQSYWLFLIRGTWLQKKTTETLIHLTKKLVGRGNEELAKKLTPTYEPGCKRITPSDHYLKQFRKEHVHLETSPIDRFTEKGIKTKDGKVTESDIIIYATGFSMLKAMNWFKIFGLDQERSQSEIMGDTPQSYYGITAPGFPNAFRLLGPNTGLAHNTVILMIESQIEYTMDAVRKLASSKKHKSMTLKKSVLEKHYKFIYDHMPTKSFGGQGGCVGWYRNDNNVCWTMWPNSTFEYWFQTIYCKLFEYKME